MIYKKINKLPSSSTDIFKGSYTQMPLFRIQQDKRNIKKYMNSLIGSFIVDAILLSDVEFEKEEEDCIIPNFNCKTEIKYTLFNLHQLANYFAYRTKISNNKCPKNNYTIFMAYYLMEIINGIHGTSLKSQVSCLKPLIGVCPNKKKCRELLKEAYEIVYLQHIDELDKSEFFKELPFKPFDDALEDFNNNGNRPISIYSILLTNDYIEKNKLTDKEIFIIEDFFSTVAITKMITLFSSKEIKLKELLPPYRKKEKRYNCKRNNLLAYYPITTNVEYFNTKGQLECYKYGMHCTYEIEYSDKLITDLNQVFDIVTDYIRGNEKNFSLDFIKTKIYSNYHFSSQIIFNTMNRWIKENDYLKYYNEMTLEQLKNNEIPDKYKKYKLSLNNIDEIREKSEKIQDKLIIEETPLCFNQQKTISILKDENTLSPFEKEIIILLIDEQCDKAKALSSASNEILSVVVDQINNIFLEILDDIVIDNYHIIEDYVEEIKKYL